LAPVYGGKERKNMNNKIKYENAPEEISESLSTSKVINDFLPPPEELIIKEKTKKVTIALSEKSIDFFKKVSKKNNVPYQQIIRKVLDNYSEHYAK